MSEQRRWDATNSVRLCDTCEQEQGVSAGADAGDRACAACGQHDAPHIYPVASDLEAAERRVEEYEKTLRLIDRRLTTVTGDNIPRGEAPKIAARELARSALSTTEEPK